MITLQLTDGWGALFDSEHREQLEQAILPEYLQSQRWFRAKARTVQAVRIRDHSRFGDPAAGLSLLTVEVSYTEGEPEHYFVPLAISSTDPVAGASVLCRVEGPEGAGVLCDALTDEASCRALLDLIAGGRSVATQVGQFRGEATAAFEPAGSGELDRLPVVPGSAEQSNSTVHYGDRFLLKILRMIEDGLNPDVEIGRFLTEQTQFRNIPATAGVILYERPGEPAATVGLLQESVRNDGTGWEHAQEVLRRYFEQIDLQPDLLPPVGAEELSLLDLAATAPPPVITRQIAEYLPFAVQLGRRTAELHLALASSTTDPDFAPQELTAADLTALADAIRDQVRSALATLRRRLDVLDEPTRIDARKVLAGDELLEGLLEDLSGVSAPSGRIRVHGDYHLGQVLRVGDDFVLLDFEGEPARDLAQRRLRQSPLKDVVGMIRSFDYAAWAALFDFARDRPAEVFDHLAPWASAWQTWISAAFLRQYLATANGAAFLPADRESTGRLLRAFTLDKALYELAYELNNRPGWVPIPLQGVLALIERQGGGADLDDDSWGEESFGEH